MVALEEMAATVPGSSTIGISAEQRRKFKRVLGLVPEQNDQELSALFRADSLNRFYVPAVMQGSESPSTSPARTVHILGSDPRARYLSHSLHDVYDVVKPVTPFIGRYENIYENGILRRNASIAKRKKRHEVEQAEEAADNGHISNLVVAGAPREAFKLMQSVKHRVDKTTAVCYMQDGLGIVEDMNNRIFQKEDSRPATAVLGHMTHALVRDRGHDAIRTLKEGETLFTSARPHVEEEAPQAEVEDARLREPLSRQYTDDMLSGFAQARLLHARGTALDNWLLSKIPALMFASVADPICVMLGYRYEQLLLNSQATRLIDQLLAEIGGVVAHISEVQRLGSHIQELLTGETMKRHIYNQLRGKKGAASEMLLQVNKGEFTNIKYLNGYFVHRARRMGMSMPANEMIISLVKAKHKAVSDKKKASFVPWVPDSKT